MRNTLHLVDVFARERYAGNQLAVVEDAGALDDGDEARVVSEDAVRLPGVRGTGFEPAMGYPSGS